MGLDNQFTWDNIEFAEGDDMFGQAPQATDEDVVEDILNDELPGQQPPANTPKPDEKPVHDFSDFEGTTEDEEVEYVEDEEEDADEKPEDKKKPGRKAAPAKIDSKSTLEFLKQKGIVEFELEEGKELTDEEADAILEDSWDASLEAGIEETIKELPDEVKALIKIATNGGNVMQMMAKLAASVSAGITKDTDMTQESNQILVMTEDLREQGYDTEEINTHIDFLKSSGKLEAMSGKAFTKKIEKQNADLAAESKRAVEAKENAKKQQREYKSAVAAHVSTLNDLNGFPINKKDKQELPGYMSEPTVELKDGRFITPMMYDFYKAQSDKDKSVLLAKILKNNFDFSTLVNTKITEETRKKRETLEEVNKTGSNGSSRQKTARVIKTVADYLD